MITFVLSSISAVLLFVLAPELAEQSMSLPSTSWMLEVMHSLFDTLEETEGSSSSSSSSGNEANPQSWWNWRQPEVDSRQLQDKTVNATYLQLDYNNEYYYYYGSFYGWSWYCSASHAGYTDVYTYEGYYSASHQESGTETETGSSAPSQMHFAYGIAGTISLLSLMRIACRVGWWCAVRLRAWVLLLRPWTVLLRNDLLDIMKIFVIAVIDVGLVLAKRAGPFKRPLRRWALRARSTARRLFRFAGAEEVEDDILMGDIDMQGEAIVYRPLHLMHARFGGGRRWKQAAPRHLRACYNPRGQGHCLFKSFGFVAAQHGCGTWSVARLRALAKQELAKSHATGIRIEGHTVTEWAQRLGRTVQELIETTSQGGGPERWGNTLDLLLLCRAFDLPLFAIDAKTQDLLMSNATSQPPRYMVVWHNFHFFVALVKHSTRVALLNKNKLPAREGLQCIHGGVRPTAGINPIVVRQFRIVGWPEEGSSTHNWGNGHDLAALTDGHLRERGHHIVSEGNTPAEAIQCNMDDDIDDTDRAQYLWQLRKLRRAITHMIHPQLPPLDRIQLGRDSDDTSGALHVLENAHELDEMLDIFRAIRKEDPAPVQLDENELDLPLPWLIIKRLRRTIRTGFHYEGLEFTAPTPINYQPVFARPAGVMRECLRDPLDLVQLPCDAIFMKETSAFFQLDWSEELPQGVVCNPRHLTDLMRQHLRDVEPREFQPILIKNDELDIALADLLVKRLRRSALDSRSKLRWWQQVNSTPVPEEDPQCVRCSPLLLVAGGGKRASGSKRPYPFAGFTAEMFEQHDEKTKRVSEAARRTAPVVIVAHGSFNPVHFGHVHMMIRAKERLEEDGLRVVAGVMALAHRDWVQAKKAQVLADDVRACLIDLMCKEFHQQTWLHADERGVGYRSYWQMKPLLAMDYPGCVFYGVWGSDSTGTSFPTGPSVCVVRRGFEGPLQSVPDQHYVVHEQHTHQFSSTKVRKAIASGDIAQVNTMLCPALAWLVVGLFSPDPVERNTSHAALRLLDQTTSEEEDIRIKAPPTRRISLGQGASSSSQQNAEHPATGALSASTDYVAKAHAEPFVFAQMGAVQANFALASVDTAVTDDGREVQANVDNSKAETVFAGVVQAGNVHAHVKSVLPAEPATNQVKANPTQSAATKAASSSRSGRHQQ
eukprot:2435826-Amphidinium_carterae.1